MYLALADRNMQVGFGLKVIWESARAKYNISNPDETPCSKNKIPYVPIPKYETMQKHRPKLYSGHDYFTFCFL